jgi:HEPN domain-containing protein
VERAEGDYRVALREAAVIDTPAFPVVCFLAQQSAEKYIKSLLTEMDISFPKTHDLVALVKLLPPNVTALPEMREPLEVLSVHAVETRYPGAEVLQTEVTEAIEAATAVRQEVRAHLNQRP